MNFFGPHSPYLNHPLLTRERTVAEVDHLLSALGISQGASVLDVGCGFGRHSLELARRGFRPTGVDPSLTMIDVAKATAAAEKLELSFIVSEDPLEAGVGTDFDAAIAMFTTIGQVGSGGDFDGSGDGLDNVTAGLLGSVARTLRPGSCFVLEVPQRAAAVRALVAAEQFGEGGNRTEINRRFDEESCRVIERFEVVSDGTAQSFDLAYRLFGAEELETLLLAAGFVDVAVFPGLGDLAEAVDRQAPPLASGRFSAARYDPQAATMVMIATNKPWTSGPCPPIGS